MKLRMTLFNHYKWASAIENYDLFFQYKFIKKKPLFADRQLKTLIFPVSFPQ